jgi:predicted Zn-dependent protease
MHSDKVLFKTALCSATLCCLIFATLATFAQTNSLPKAGFQTYSRPSDSNLPQTNGLHLTPGEDRAPGSPPQIYNPGEPTLNMALVRWEKKKMPLAVWISPGLQLPFCPYEEIQATRVDQVFQLLRQPDGLSSLRTAAGWTPEMNDIVAAGIQEWSEFEPDGISFRFTDDPHAAQILIFFTDVFSGGDQTGGIAVGGITSAQVYPWQQAQQINIAQKPVITEISTVINNTNDKLRGAAAHEFGHALGIKAHSPYREDLMYVDRVVNELSSSDKATLRYLYSKQPAYVL